MASASTEKGVDAMPLSNRREVASTDAAKSGIAHSRKL